MRSNRIKQNTNKLTVCGIMVALATVLSFIKITQLPFGGEITLFSYVPILFIGYAYGVKWGIAAGIANGIIQMAFGISSSISGAGFKWWQILLCALLDYIISYGILGLSGIFKKSIKKSRLSFSLGILVACFAKYAMHILSGFILFSGWAEWFFSEGAGTPIGDKILGEFSGQLLALIYSTIYNGAFMIPETISSIVIGIILISVKPVRRILFEKA